MIVKVAILKRLPKALEILDYEVPADLIKNIQVGSLLSVPFRTQTARGIVIELLTETAQVSSKLRAISSVLLTRPIIPAKHLRYLREISERYMAPLGILLKSALPNLNKNFLKKLASLPPVPAAGQLGLQLAEPSASLFCYKNEREYLAQLVKRIGLKAQTLVLLPEIIAVEKFLLILPKKFKKYLFIFTSKSTEIEFKKLSLALFAGEPALVIGTRASLFLPFSNLKQIFVIDEGNPSYKSFDSAPRYESRDLADLLAEQHQLTAQYFAHSPSLSLYHKIRQTHSSSFVLPKFEAKIIYLNDERKAGNFNILSELVANRLLENKEKSAFLFLNRKGVAQVVYCADCKQVFHCPKCNANLAIVKNNSGLTCPNCDYQSAARLNCPNCSGFNIRLLKPGLDLVKKELQKLVGSGRTILTLEKDSELTNFKITPGTIVIGTAFAWNKINWGDLSLAAFIDPDSAFYSRDITAEHNLWYAIRDAASKLGSALIIQTSYPEKSVFAGISNPEYFLDQQLQSAKQFGFPPFVLVLKLFADFENPVIAAKEVNLLKAKLIPLTVSAKNITITTEVNDYTGIILLKINADKPWDVVKQVLSLITGPWKADINPQNFSE